MWSDFGFTENPYNHRPIPPNDIGERLLVGRGAEIATIMRRITAGSSCPTLEGPNGVGKTSLVAVATFKLLQRFLNGSMSACYIPTERFFQISAETNLSEFKQEVYRYALLSLHERRDDLLRRGLNLGNTAALFNWLTAVRYASGGGSIGPISIDVGVSPNETDGFSENGFVFAVQRLIDEAFPNSGSGGIVCVLDNLEILETSRKAREVLEEMRDTLFTQRGFVWVICGAKGIVRSVASSPRLQGVLSDPFRVRPISQGEIGGLVDARVESFGIPGQANAPVDERGFSHLFKITNENLRNTLKFCSDFSDWLADQNLYQLEPGDKFGLLESWIAQKSSEYMQDAKSVTDRSWEVFDGIVTMGGAISPNDYASFGFESQQAMRPHIKRLEEANLVDSLIDEEDSRRRTISITSLGYFVNYSRSGYPI